MTDKEFSPFIESFASGKASRAGDVLGARLSGDGALFRVWAPNALDVSVAGDFNGWDGRAAPMKRRNGGIWELLIPGVKAGDSYKYVISAPDGQTLWKADPYGFYSELRPSTASRIYELEGYSWRDGKWLERRREHKVYSSPMNIYEVHLASWARNEDGQYLSYGQAADRLIPYVKSMGFTHIELMPLTEYPYDASWGYQCTGYFAATSRFGSPHDLMGFIDRCHRAGIGVIMDWVPAHFPKDPHGLVEFDGTRLYEDSDPQMAEHPSWGTRIFDYNKGEVRSFLISSALFWLEKYHIDGLRVDAVASMLYLDYDRRNSWWRPNRYGGNENLEAVDFLRELNRICFSYDDSILMIAEESTAWPMVTAPADIGGLGFNLKWNMGWMNDTQSYLKSDPYFRSGCHNQLTFSIMYAFSENFVLPMSHDEVVHMKGSLMNKAPGSREQRMATVRAFWAYMLAHPGKKLLFMGAELGQESEWNFAASLPWELLERPENQALNGFFAEANLFYRKNRPLWAVDFSGEGFMWLCADERDRNILAFMRRDDRGRKLFFLCSFSGAENRAFRLGVPEAGHYAVTLSTDSLRFGGEGRLEEDKVFTAEPVPYHGQNHSILIDVPPLTAIFFKKTRAVSPRTEAAPAKGMGAPKEKSASTEARK